MILIDRVAEVGPIAARRRLLKRYKKGDLGPGPFAWFIECREHGQNFHGSGVHCISCEISADHNEGIWQELEARDAVLHIIGKEG